MQLIIKNKVNYVEEANAFLFYYVNKEAFEKLKAYNIRRLSADTARFDRITELIEKIREHVIENMRIDNSKLEFYFKKLGNSYITPAYFLLPLFPDIKYNSLEDYENAAHSKNNSDLWKDFEYILSQEYALGSEAKENKAAESFEDIMRMLDGDESLSVDDRWKIIQAYLNHDQYVDEICDILHKIIQLIKECQNEVDLLEQVFDDYWMAYSKKNDLLKEMQKHSGFTWEYSKKGTYIIPSIFFSQSIIYSIFEIEEEREDIIHLGLLVDSGFLIKQEAVDMEDINNSLKLLSDKSKFDILMYIKNKPAYGFEIANALKLSTSTISYHMNGLVNAHLVKIKKDANKVYYQIDEDTVRKLLDDIEGLLL